MLTPDQLARHAAAAEQLRKNLNMAGRIYAAPESPDHRRMAVRAAVNAVLAFLEVALADDHELLRAQMFTPLNAIAVALGELDRGLTSPLFEPARVLGHPPAPHGREMTKGGAAAAMSLLMEVGHSREEAATRVARQLVALGVKLEGNRQLNWRTVASWRDQVMKAGPVRDDTGMYATYCLGLANWAPPDGLDKEARVRYVDEMLRFGLSWLLGHGGS
jgi:hypothetical protein